MSLWRRKKLDLGRMRFKNAPQNLRLPSGVSLSLVDCVGSAIIAPEVEEERHSFLPAARRTKSAPAGRRPWKNHHRTGSFSRISFSLPVDRGRRFARVRKEKDAPAARFLIALFG